VTQVRSQSKSEDTTETDDVRTFGPKSWLTARDNLTLWPEVALQNSYVAKR